MSGNLNEHGHWASTRKFEDFQAKQIGKGVNDAHEEPITVRLLHPVRIGTRGKAPLDPDGALPHEVIGDDRIHMYVRQDDGTLQSAEPEYVSTDRALLYLRFPPPRNGDWIPRTAVTNPLTFIDPRGPSPEEQEREEIEERRRERREVVFNIVGAGGFVIGTLGAVGGLMWHDAHKNQQRKDAVSAHVRQQLDAPDIAIVVPHGISPDVLEKRGVRFETSSIVIGEGENETRLAIPQWTTSIEVACAGPKSPLTITCRGAEGGPAFTYIITVHSDGTVTETRKVP